MRTGSRVSRAKPSLLPTRSRPEVEGLAIAAQFQALDELHLEGVGQQEDRLVEE
ncbi:hypothetical protein ACN28E_03560 [Archangium lansingense]|uniref:hypothetical protein n=1 Tax=Archangium lansingense TaxID=2995310 RepID=UPI003B7CFC11